MISDVRSSLARPLLASHASQVALHRLPHALARLVPIMSHDRSSLALPLLASYAFYRLRCTGCLTLWREGRRWHSVLIAAWLGLCSPLTFSHVALYRLPYALAHGCRFIFLCLLHLGSTLAQLASRAFCNTTNRLPRAQRDGCRYSELKATWLTARSPLTLSLLLLICYPTRFGAKAADGISLRLRLGSPIARLARPLFYIAPAASHAVVRWLMPMISRGTCSLARPCSPLHCIPLVCTVATACSGAWLCRWYHICAECSLARPCSPLTFSVLLCIDCLTL